MHYEVDSEDEWEEEPEDGEQLSVRFTLNVMLDLCCIRSAVASSATKSALRCCQAVQCSRVCCSGEH